MRRRRIGRLGELHRAASSPRKKTMPKRFSGWVTVAGVGPALGFGQVSSSPIFFCSVPFLFCFIFSFQISNLVLLNHFAGFELAIHLQDFEFEITYQICRRHF
jgi:hypothetical protein